MKTLSPAAFAASLLASSSASGAIILNSSAIELQTSVIAHLPTGVSQDADELFLPDYDLATFNGSVSSSADSGCEWGCNSSATASLNIDWQLNDPGANFHITSGVALDGFGDGAAGTLSGRMYYEANFTLTSAYQLWGTGFTGWGGDAELELESMSSGLIFWAGDGNMYYDRNSIDRVLPAGDYRFMASNVCTRYVSFDDLCYSDIGFDLRFVAMSPVPLPPAVPLIVSGLALLVTVGRRRRQR